MFIQTNTFEGNAENEIANGLDQVIDFLMEKECSSDIRSDLDTYLGYIKSQLPQNEDTSWFITGPLLDDIEKHTLTDSDGKEYSIRGYRCRIPVVIIDNTKSKDDLECSTVRWYCCYFKVDDSDRIIECIPIFLLHNANLN
jgi:hypothetical protein